MNVNEGHETMIQTENYRFRRRDNHKWIVFVAAIAVGFFNYGFPCTMGALYISMLDTFGAGRAATALVQSLTFLFCCGFGVLTGFLISRFGITAVCCVGALLSSVGLMLSFFASSIYHLYAFISVISGIGFNIMYVSAVVCVGWTFTGNLKSMILSTQSVGTAISGFMWPHLFNLLLRSFGLRGTLLVMGGLFLHNIVFAIIFAHSKFGQFQNKNVIDETEISCNNLPVKTQVEFEADTTADVEMEEYCTQEDQINGVDEHNACNKALIKTDQISLAIDETATDPLIMDMVRPNHTKYHQHVNYDARNTGANKQTVTYSWRSSEEQVTQESDNDFQGNKTANGSETDADRMVCDNGNGAIVEEMTGDNKTAIDADKTKRRCTCSPLFCLYLIYALAGILHMSTQNGFLTMYQDLNVSNGMTIEQSDLTFMSYSLFNILSRFLPIIPARIERINSFAVPLFASLCGAIGQLIYLTNPSFTTAVVAMGFAAFPDGAWSASMQSIMFEILPMEKQAVGFGLVMTAFGVASTATGPIFGALRDSSTSYRPVLITTATLFLVSALLELVCLIKHSRYKHRQSKKRARVSGIASSHQRRYP